MYSSIHPPPCCRCCRFFRPMDISEDGVEGALADDAVISEIGRCVRMPPTFFYKSLLNAEFPVVNAETWCGEFQRAGL